MFDVIQLIAKRAITLGATLCLIAIGVSGVSSVAMADEGDSLGALWWQHALSIPSAQNPILDQTGEYCGIGQYGDTWFLHGTFGSFDDSELTVRDCSVPAGRRFFVPLVNWICTPWPGETVKENVEICQWANDFTNILELMIDGVRSDWLIKRRAQRKAFDVTLSANNVWGNLPGTYVAVHDGYWALLPKLSPGVHTVEIRGGSTTWPAELGGPFYINVLYNLTVTEAVFIDPPASP